MKHGASGRVGVFVGAVEQLLQIIIGKPTKWELVFATNLAAFDGSTKFEFRKDMYATFFTLAPVGQDFFKQ